MSNLRPTALWSIFILSLLALTTVISVSAATTRANDVKVMYYDKWQTIPDDRLMDMGDDYMDRQMYDSTLVCYSIVANRYYEHDRLTADQADKCIKAMNRLGYLYHFYLYDYQKAYGYLHLAEKLSHKYNNPTHLPYILRDIAGIFNSYSNLNNDTTEEPDSLGPYGNAFRASVMTDDKNAIVSIYINMLDPVSSKEELDSLNEATEIFFSLNPYKDNIKLYEYARCLFEGKRAIANEDYDKALRMFTEMGNNIESTEPAKVRYRLQALSKQSLAYFMMGKESEAVTKMEELASMAKNNNVIDVEVNVYETLSRFYRDHGDLEKSMHYRVKFLNAKDSIMSQHNLIKVKEMKFLNELDSINEEMRQLSYKRKMERYFTIGVCVIAILLLLIVAIFIYNNRQLKIKNRSIYERSVEALNAEKTMREMLEKMKSQNECPIDKDAAESTETKYQNSDLSEAEKKEIEGRIRFIMENSDEIYQEGFSIDQLSSLANTKKRHVSQVINEQFGKPFTALLCDYRIKEACRRINDTDNYGKYTIGAIALSVGFKSQSNFVSNFKRIMGLTPSEYQRQAKE